MVALTGIEPCISRVPWLRRRSRELGARLDLARKGGSSNQRAVSAQRARDALGGFWGDPAVHGWVNSGKDG